MTVHLLKLCVGVPTVERLIELQKERLARNGQLRHFTRNFPRREYDVLNGGSLYWVIDGFVRVRQRIVGLERETDEDGRGYCAIGLDPELVRTELQPRRPHQGWRYLEDADAPPDLDRTATAGLEEEGAPSPEMLAELKELGLI